MRAVAFTGPSNSGKTTIITKISLALKSKDKRVSIIKHDPKDKASFDTKGKDSHNFFQTGANVAVVSPTRTTLFFHQNHTIEEIIDKFGDFDLLMVEGLKWLDLPRVGIFRDEIDVDYLDRVMALAVDDSVDLDRYDIPAHIDILDLNNTQEIIEWIEKNAKEINKERN